MIPFWWDSFRRSTLFWHWIVVITLWIAAGTANTVWGG